MKADTSLPTKSTLSKSANGTTTKPVKTRPHGPIPGNGPWFRLDGIWYTKDEAGEWVKMPGQPEAKRVKRAEKTSSKSGNIPLT